MKRLANAIDSIPSSTFYKVLVGLDAFLGLDYGLTAVHAARRGQARRAWMYAVLAVLWGAVTVLNCLNLRDAARGEGEPSGEDAADDELVFSTSTPVA